MLKMSKIEKIALWLLAIYILFRCLCAIAGTLGFFETDYEREIRRNKQKLNKILTTVTPTEIDKLERYDALREFAREVGAGAENTVIGTPYKDPRDERATIIPNTIISESELVNNINIALQTDSAISAQIQAVKTNRIAFLAFLVSLGAALGSIYAIRTTSQVKK